MIISEKKQSIKSPECVANILNAILDSEHETDRDKEHFWAIGLDTKKKIKYIELISLGILNRSLIHPREVFRLAILKAVDSIIVIHNHPSGDISPSESDIEITNKLIEGGKLLCIEIIDHIIIGDGYYSFRKEGLI